MLILVIKMKPGVGICTTIIATIDRTVNLSSFLKFISSLLRTYSVPRTVLEFAQIVSYLILRTLIQLSILAVGVCGLLERQ